MLTKENRLSILNSLPNNLRTMVKKIEAAKRYNAEFNTLNMLSDAYSNIADNELENRVISVNQRSDFSILLSNALGEQKVITLRLTPEFHKHLLNYAKTHNLSLNTLCLSLIGVLTDFIFSHNQTHEEYNKTMKENFPDASSQETTETCEFCQKELPVSEMIHGPDPYNLDINDDHTERTFCSECSANRAADI